MRKKNNIPKYKKNSFNTQKFKKSSSLEKTNISLKSNYLIALEDLAVIFHLTPQTLRNWVALGKIPSVKIGRKRFFQQVSLQKWLDQKEDYVWQ